MKQKVRRLHFQGEILIPGGLVLLLMCIFLSLSAYRSADDGMVEMGVEEAGMVAKMALTSTDGNILEQMQAGKWDSRDYDTMLENMRKLKKEYGIAYLYTVYLDGDKICYGIDSDESDEQAQPGDEFDGITREDLNKVLAGSDFAQNYIDHTEDGDLITVYKPITNSSGKVIAALGCDYNAKDVVKQLDKVRSKMVTFSVISIVVAFFVFLLIVRRISKGLRNINQKIYDLVNNEGDLTQKLTITTGDELELIANNINALLDYIRGIIINIAGNSDGINSSSHIVVDSLSSAKDNLQDVSATIEELSAAMEETNVSLVEVNEAVNQIYNTTQNMAQKASDESGNAENVMKKAHGIYANAQEEQKHARHQAKAMAEAVHDKIEKSKTVEQINNLTAEIINITNQTSLLSLNASIEAARAGEAGKGFAVVATEIGSLAMNSENAAKEINQVSGQVIEAVEELAAEADKMIEFLMTETQAGYDQLLDNSMNYQNDVESLNQVLQLFTDECSELKAGMDRINESISAIRIAVEESTTGITNVAGLSSDLNNGMEKIAGEAEGNQDIAGRLQGEVGKFKY